jgi:aspartyl protease family protein
MSESHNSRPAQSKWIVALFWMLFLGSLTLFFNGYLQQQNNPNYNLVAGQQQQVTLQRNRSGHYVAPGFINGQSVSFLLDTGATHMSVPADVARSIGLRAGRPTQVSTANGVVQVYQTVLDSVQLGGIEMRNVQASINPYMPDDTVLLGMSFMKQLDMIQQQGTLTLKVPQS